MPMAKISVGKPLLLFSQATSTTAHVALDLTNLLEDPLELSDHLRLALLIPFQLPLVAPGFLELEPLGDP
jgi:hypothetical protein